MVSRVLWRALACSVLIAGVTSCGSRDDESSRARGTTPAGGPAAGGDAPPSTTADAGEDRPGVRALEPAGSGARAGGPTVGSFAPLVERVKGAVVNVEVVSRELAPEANPFDPFFGPGERGPGDGSENLRRGAGSGFIVDARGLVLTNNHVVEGARSIRVRLEDGRVLEGTVAGRDPLTDVAVVRLRGDAGRLPTVKLGDSEAVRVGDWVVAIGNPFGLASSVSSGIISAKARDIGAGPYDDFLQTDAAINPGNSGGPLFDLSGAVIGMNTAIAGGGTGVGFAVPANIMRSLLPQLEKGEAVQRGWLGVTVQDLTPDLAQALGVAATTRGAVITDVAAGSPAAGAGLRPDDVVTAVEGKPIGSAAALTRSVAFQAPGTTLVLHVLRAGQDQDVKVRLGAAPAPSQPVAAREDAEAREPGRLGLAFRDVPPEVARAGGPSRGALVAQVRPGSPADAAGLEPGMVVVSAGGRRIASARDLEAALRSARPDSVLLLRVQVGEAKLLRALRVPREGLSAASEGRGGPG
jgi:serine protease Do